MAGGRVLGAYTMGAAAIVVAMQTGNKPRLPDEPFVGSLASGRGVRRQQAEIFQLCHEANRENYEQTNSCFSPMTCKRCNFSQKSFTNSGFIHMSLA